jgi:CRP-like cAMP-binding protein
VGEIALLRGIPRTATVRATRSTRAYALEGPDFIAAVTASPLAAAAADAVVARRVPEVGVGA